MNSTWFKRLLSSLYGSFVQVSCKKRYPHMHTHTHTCTLAHTHTHTGTLTHVHKHTHKYTPTTHPHTHTHTHTARNAVVVLVAAMIAYSLALQPWFSDDIVTLIKEGSSSLPNLTAPEVSPQTCSVRGLVTCWPPIMLTINHYVTLIHIYISLFRTWV